MKKIVITFMLSLLCYVVSAQSLYVYSIIGKAEVLQGNDWVKLEKRAKLSSKDNIRVGENSALSLLDRDAEKIYSIPETTGDVSKIIESLKDKQQNVSSQFFQHAMRSMFNGGSDKISHSAAGCTYRGDEVEFDISRSIQQKLNGAKMDEISNEKTDYSISFEVIKRNTKEKVEGNANIGEQSFFRIKNNSNKPMYVNILDIDAQGKRVVCLPMDDAQTMAHLLIPANCTIDLTDYSTEFTESKGTDCMILVAAENPFDLRMVSNKIDESDNKNATKHFPVGIYKKKTTVE